MSRFRERSPLFSEWAIISNHLSKRISRLIMKYTLFRSFLALLAASALLPANAQGPQLTTVVPPTPNAAAFQKYGDIPVSAYTGVPDISIPLYTAKFRDISIPISLSYHA